MQFEDIDRDGMVDMFYMDRSADGIILNIHYNRLLNADREKDKNKIKYRVTIDLNKCSKDMM